MRAVRLTLLCALLSLSPCLHAQLAAYGTYDFTRYTANSYSPSTTVNYNGGGLGVYYDFLHLGPVRAGVDLRGDLQSGNQAKYQTVLAGARVSAKLPVLPFRPYVQGSLGESGGKYTGALPAGIGTQQYSGKFMYAVFGGVDYGIVPHVEFRAIEIGYGRRSDSSSANTPIKDSLLLISSGVVVRFW